MPLEFLKRKAHRTSRRDRPAGATADVLDHPAGGSRRPGLPAQAVLRGQEQRGRPAQPAPTPWPSCRRCCTGSPRSEIEVVEPLPIEFSQATPTISRPSEAMQWLNAHHVHSPVTRHALVVLESIDAIDLEFDTFVCALLDGDVDTSGYPEYSAVVGGVASHWDESTGDMIVRAVVGWGGKGVRGDTDRIGAKLLGPPDQRPGQPVRARPDRGRAAGSGRPAAAASSAPTAGSRHATSGRSTARSAACACCAADPERPSPVPIYDYTCSACGHLTEVVHGIHDHGPTFCPECGAEGTMTKAFTTPAIHFKGSGWAKKDRSSASRRARRRRTRARRRPTADGDRQRSGRSAGGSTPANVGRPRSTARRSTSARRGATDLTAPAATDWITWPRRARSSRRRTSGSGPRRSAAGRGPGKLQSIKLGGRRFVGAARVKALVAGPRRVRADDLQPALFEELQG